MTELEDIVVRTATLDDQSDLLDFFIEHLDYTRCEYNRRRMEIFCEGQGHGTILATHQGQIVAALQWEVQENIMYGLAQVEEVFVDLRYRGQQIGTRMVQLGLETLKQYYAANGAELKTVWLFCRQGNDPAVRVYEKFGFKKRTGHPLGDLFKSGEPQDFYVADIAE